MTDTNKTKEQLTEEWDTASRLGEQPITMLAKRRSTLLRLLVVVILSIFVAEVFVMFLLAILPPVSVPIEALLDGLLLSVLVLPIIYLFLFRPLRSSITEFEQMGSMLKEAHDKLEVIVGERTLELTKAHEHLEERVKQRTKELEELGQQLRERDRERGDLLKKIITTQEEERQRIARELHDEVGQSLTSLMIGFKVLETQDPEEMRQGITELKQLTAQTLDEVRHLALELRPSSLDDLGLIAALQQYAREYSDKFGVNADFQASGFEAKRLQPQTEIALYRIIQEALTNVAKHSEAKKVSVLMRVRDSSIVAIVEDNGKGFDVQRVLASRTRERKLGLYGMQERAALIGGVLTIESTPDAGTTIFVEVPLKGDEVK